MARSRKPVGRIKAPKIRTSARPIKTRKGEKFIRALNEDHPNVRLVYNKRLTSREYAAFRAYAKRVLDQLGENIRTNMGGDWKPIQWNYQNGKREGDLALQHTERQWMVELVSAQTIRIKPRPEFAVRWHAHIQGMLIKAKGKRGMRIPFHPTTTYLQKVQLPVRDPRPTRDQLMRIAKEQ